MDEAIAKVAAAAKKHHKIFGFHAAEELTRKWMPTALPCVWSLMDITCLQGYGGHHLA
jgi:2-dehydro-3-deoxyglucarate aldolase/4-hydroxy-2-oxoheptanedioate aldolase